MKIDKDIWNGNDGQPEIEYYTIQNQAGNYVVLSSYGACIMKVVIGDKNGRKRDVVLGYETPGEYRLRGEFLGACVGRFGGWIKDGKIRVGGREYRLYRNDGKNHLHGGKMGFDKQLWSGEIQDDKVIFRRVSPDGEENYPGALNVEIAYGFTEENTLSISYHAVCDSDTVCNLTNHTYFNLDGEGKILGHRLLLKSDWLNDNDEDGISCLGVRPVDHTPFDFRTEKQIGRDLDTECDQLLFGHGYDHNYVLGRAGERKLAAVLRGETSGISMEVWTNQSGIQLYTGNYLEGWPGKNGMICEKNSGVCLETQFCPSFEERKRGDLYPILKKNEAYCHEVEYHFYTEQEMIGDDTKKGVI